MNDNNTDNVTGSASNPDALPTLREGDLSGGLRIVENLPGDQESGDWDQESEDEGTDLLHVFGVNQDCLDSSKLGFNGRRGRVMSFEPDILGLLHYSPFIKDTIEYEAHRLLRGLKYFRQKQARPTPIIIVAYDLGSLVVKKAVAIAKQSLFQWTDIFMSLEMFIFFGCFQRGDVHVLRSKMFEYLNDQPHCPRNGSFTLDAVVQLASATLDINELFLDSKITLRSKILSLYANHGSSEGRLNKVFDDFTATLGISTELAFVESIIEDQEYRLFELNRNPRFGSRVASDIVFREYELAQTLELSLLCLVPRDCVMLSNHHQQPTLQGLLEHDSYRAWAQGGGLQILYIHDSDETTAIKAAEQVSRTWRAPADRQAANTSGSRFLYFTFSTQDPRYSSMAALLSTMFLHALTESADGQYDLYLQALVDQHRLYHSWSDKDLFNLASICHIWKDIRLTVKLIAKIHECDARDRRELWSFLASKATGVETPIKIVIPSSKQSLLEELKNRPELDSRVQTIDLSDIVARTSNICGDGDRQQQISINQSQPWTHLLDRDQLRRLKSSLAKLREEMSETRLADIVKICSIQTHWHDHPSPRSFSHYCDLVAKVNQQSTPGGFLSSLLQSTSEKFDAQLALSWVFCGYRMVTLHELAMLLNLHNMNHPEPRLDEGTSRAVHYIESQMHIILDTSGNRVKIREDVRSFLDDDADRIWNRARCTGPRITVDFLFHYLTLEWVQERLQRLWTQYETRLLKSELAISDPVVEDGQDIIFYAVQGLPHHILAVGASDISKETRDQMQKGTGPYKPWARMFWAMSNPFSRPSGGPWNSAWEAVTSTGQASMASIIQATVAATRTTSLQDDNQEEALESEFITELVETLRRRHDSGEARALSLAREIVERRQATRDTEVRISWDTSILWQATWYGARELVDYLLDHGVCPDEFNGASSCSPSPLYLAARLGNFRIMNALLQHEADHTLRKDKRGALDAAIRSSEVRAIRSLVDHGASIESDAVYSAAAEGLPEVVETLLSPPINATPQSQGPDGWFAISITCDRGYTKSLGLLLEHSGEKNIQTCHEALSIGAKSRNGRSMDCIRLLLDHGADPNHVKLPPLAISMVRDDNIPSDAKLAMLELLARHQQSLDINAPDADGFTPLMVAAVDGDVAVLHWLLNNGAQVDATNDNGAYALYFAVQEGKISVVQELLEQKPPPRLDIQTPSDVGDTTLLEVAVQDDLSILKSLIDSGANLETTDQAGSTALITSVFWRRADAVKMLIDSGANLHHRNQNGLTPILASIRRSNDEVVRLLAENGADLSDTNNNGSNALHLAAWEVIPSILRILLEFRKYDIEARDDDGDTPLLCLVDLDQAECLECLRILLRAGADINAQRKPNGLCLLTRAAAFGNSGFSNDFIHTLLSAPEIDLSSVERRKGTALHIACQKQNVDLILRLLDRGADVNLVVSSEIGTCLSAACMPDVGGRQSKDVNDLTDQIVRILVLRGANVNAIAGHTIFTELSVAAWSASVKTINYLVGEGASVTELDPLGRMAIHYAAGNGILNFEAVALRYTGNLMVSDVGEKNVLHWAAQYGHVETLRAILQKVANTPERRRLINHPDKDGWTPLAWASRPDLSTYRLTSEPRDYYATIKYLIDEGADKSVRFRVGQDGKQDLTPFIMAQRCGASEDILELLCFSEDSLESRDSGYVAKKELEYLYQDNWWCDICLMGIFGLVYQCDVCPSFTICSKCYGNIDVYHKFMRDRDGQQHNFFLPSGRDVEFKAPTTSSSRSSSLSFEGPSQPSSTAAGSHTRNNMSRPVSPSGNLGGSSLDSLSSVGSDAEEDQE